MSLTSACRSMCDALFTPLLGSDALFTPLLGGALCCAQQTPEPNQNATRPLRQQRINFTTPARRQNQNNTHKQRTTAGVTSLGPNTLNTLEPRHAEIQAESARKTTSRTSNTSARDHTHIRPTQSLCRNSDSIGISMSPEMPTDDGCTLGTRPTRHFNEQRCLRFFQSIRRHACWRDRKMVGQNAATRHGLPPSRWMELRQNLRQEWSKSNDRNGAPSLMQSINRNNWVQDCVCPAMALNATIRR